MNNSQTEHTTFRNFEARKFIRNVRRDSRDVREYFLDEERKARLGGMGRFKAFFVTLGWLLSGLYRKLSPNRRILLVIGIVLIVLSGSIEVNDDQLTIRSDTALFGGAILLFVLMLELRDKSLAHEELQAGHAVQTAFMPEKSPAVPGWDLWLMTRPANDVGGDLIDCVHTDPSNCCVALGDVSGKGLPAALFMVKLQATLRALRQYASSLPDFAYKVNEVFHRDKIPNTFASLIYTEFGATPGEVKLINAGHILPIIFNAQGMREVPKSGPALGLIPNHQFEEQCVHLNEGDVLLLYSDGLTEARNEQGEFFGEKRLAALLPILRDRTSAEIGAEILSEIDRFIGEAPLYDDLSLVVLRPRMGK